LNYRHVARNALGRAKQQLENIDGDDHPLRYAALELRLALESIIYERAESYKEELSGKKLSTWQPKKLLSLLIEIDHSADKSSILSFGLEEEYGKPAKIMKSLGKERVLSLSEIKKYYDRLGSYLHTPTLDQVALGKGATPVGIRTRCIEVTEILEQVLASPIFNVNFNVTSTITCGKCGTKIVRRIPPVGGVKSIIAKCIECSACYSLATMENDQIEWKPLVRDVKCATPSCNSKISLWESEIEVGTCWTCVGCNAKNQIVLAVAIAS
jgi:hypothetical protein